MNALHDLALLFAWLGAFALYLLIAGVIGSIVGRIFKGRS